MADFPSTFEGTPTATLQAIHDCWAAYLSGNKAARGIQSYTIDGRNVVDTPFVDAMKILSVISNELARRALPSGGARDDFYDTVFGDAGGGVIPPRGTW